MRLWLTIPLALLIVGCSQTPVRKAQQPAPTPAPVETVAPSASLSIEQLRTRAEQARSRGDLNTLTEALTELWRRGDAEEQLLIEYLLYDLWLRTTADQLSQRVDDEAPEAAWQTLAELLKAGDPGALEKALMLYPEAPYGRHLAHYLARPHPQPRNIAVFLPLSGRYAVLGRRIRAGMLHAIAERHSSVVLQFHDSATDPDGLILHYRQALDAGADAIIGPLRPDAVRALSQTSQLPALLLNQPENGYGLALTFPTPTEAAQIMARLDRDGHRIIAVIHLEKPLSAKLAARIETDWPSDRSDRPPRRVVTQQAGTSAYRDLRRRLDMLLHVDRSQQRIRQLQWLLGRRLAADPRPRQDLDALVLLTAQAQAAVFKPLLAFYGLKLPVYGSSLMMPDSAAPSPFARDLVDIQFPGFPGLLDSPPTAPFESWGHDALLLMLTQPPPGSCIKGRTGWLHRNGDNLWARRLIWLKYGADGKLKKADAP